MRVTDDCDLPVPRIKTGEMCVHQEGVIHSVYVAMVEPITFVLHAYYTDSNESHCQDHG